MLASAENIEKKTHVITSLTKTQQGLATNTPVCHQSLLVLMAWTRSLNHGVLELSNESVLHIQSSADKTMYSVLQN